MTNRTQRIHRFFALANFIAAILTAIPVATASKACRLGYKVLCSFTRYGTVILLAMGFFHIWMTRKETAND
jgi:hypothetical protein